MTIKTKKFLLSGLSLLFTSTALAAISCGAGRFEQTEKDEIRILSGFRKDTPQYRAVIEILRMYNETQKDTPDFLKVSFDTDERSYRSVFTRLSQGLESKDRANLWNLALHYPVTVAQLESYDMRLRFDANEKDKDDYGITRDAISDGFLAFNDLVEGVPTGQISGIPFGKSTIVSSINAPILSYAMETMVMFGATVKQESMAWYNKLKEDGAADRDFVKSLWGEPVESERSKYTGYVIDHEKILNNGLELLDFSILAQDLFSKSHKNPTGELNFLGNGDPAGFISTMLYSMVAGKKNDYEKYYIRLKDGNIDYNSFSEKDTPAFNALKEITEKLIKASENGAFYTLSRPSFRLRQFKIGISIGSTSSYHENYSNSTRPSNDITLAVDEDGKKNAVNISFRNVGRLKKDAETDYLVNFSGSGTQGILKSTSTLLDSNLTGGKMKSYSDAVDGAITSFVNSLSASSLLNSAILRSADVDKVWEKSAGRANLEADGIKLLGKVKVFDRGRVEEQNIYGVPDLYDTNKTKVGITFTIHNKLLKEKGLTVNHAPRKWKPENTFNTVYLQGPSLIGIHSNEKGDKATRKFVKWLTSETEYDFKFYNSNSKSDEESEKYEPKYMDDENTHRFKSEFKGKIKQASEAPVKFRPLRYMYEASSYLAPYKGFFTDVKPFNRFAINSFEEFQATKADDWQLLEEPANSLADSFRNALNDAISGAVNRRFRGTAGSSDSYETEVYPALRNNGSSFGSFSAPAKL